MCLLYVCRGPGVSEKIVRYPVAGVTDSLMLQAKLPSPISWKNYTFLTTDPSLQLHLSEVCYLLIHHSSISFVVSSLSPHCRCS